MVVFDAAMLLFLFSARVGVPKDPVTGKPVERAKERVELRLAALEKARTKVIIPTPALAEILVHAGAAAAEQLAKINGSAAFRVVDFDQRAAVQVALMAQDRGDRPKNQTETYAKLKYDRQIAAIAKVEGASAIYTDDERLQSYAERLKIPFVGISDLPLPEPEQEDLFAGPLAEDANVDVDIAETPFDGEPTGAVQTEGSGTGVQNTPGGVRDDAGDDRDSEPSPEVEEDQEGSKSGIAAPDGTREIHDNPHVASSIPASSTDTEDASVAQRESAGLTTQDHPVEDRRASSSTSLDAPPPPSSPEKS